MTIIDHEVKTTIEAPVVSDDEGTRRELLLRAAEIIERDGFVTGPEGMHIGDGPKCLLGAVAKASEGRVQTWRHPDWHEGGAGESWDIFQTVQLIPGGPTYEDVYHWSDTRQFTKENARYAEDYELGARRVASGLRQMANGLTFQEMTGGFVYDDRRTWE